MSRLTKINAAKAKQAKDDAFIQRTVVQSLMSHAQGRRWVWLELAEAGLFQAQDVTNHAFMAAAEGKRQIGLRLWAAVTRHCAQEFVLMLNEANSIQLKFEPEEEEEEDEHPEE